MTDQWPVMVCEMGNDLAMRRCHIAHWCSNPAACNAIEHHCSCEWFTVKRVTATDEKQKTADKATIDRKGGTDATA